MTQELTGISTPICLEAFLSCESGTPPTAAAQSACRAIAHQLQKYGIVVIRDPRVTTQHNADFLDMMERYFEQDDETKKDDERPELGYQIGVTPSGTETAKVLSDAVAQKFIESVSGCMRRREAHLNILFYIFSWRRTTSLMKLLAPMQSGGSFGAPGRDRRPPGLPN